MLPGPFDGWFSKQTAYFFICVKRKAVISVSKVNERQEKRCIEKSNHVSNFMLILVRFAALPRKKSWHQVCWTCFKGPSLCTVFSEPVTNQWAVLQCWPYFQYVMGLSEEDDRKMDEIRKFSAIYGRFDCKRKQDKPLTLHEVIFCKYFMKHLPSFFFFLLLSPYFFCVFIRNEAMWSKTCQSSFLFFFLFFFFLRLGILEFCKKGASYIQVAKEADLFDRTIRFF